ncbi:MAG: HIT domain-containing protein [Candidatus Lokiarchaeota archaeon]|nr:HIT domain-containing protein [Candidatus Lokiarchaeota archaeon]
MGPDDPFKKEALFPGSLYARGKSEYVTGGKPDVPCILCAVRDGDPAVRSHVVHQDGVAFIILNLYPFNPGHLLISPTRHVERWRDLADGEVARIMGLVKQAEDVLEREFGCTSFNFGVNEGKFSGASIDHLHVQLIPRFRSELGFIDTVGRTRAMVFSLEQVLEKLKGKFA